MRWLTRLDMPEEVVPCSDSNSRPTTEPVHAVSKSSATTDIMGMRILKMNLHQAAGNYFGPSKTRNCGCVPPCLRGRFVCPLVPPEGLTQADLC